MARGLVKKQTHTIGVIIPDLANSFFSEVTEGILDSASEHGYTTLLCVSNWNVDEEKKYLQTLQEKRVDGIILKPANDFDNKHLEQITVPYIILEGWKGDENCSHVKVDNQKGAYIGTKYLLERGYKHIAFAGGKKGSYSNAQRIKGYKAALEEQGILIDDQIILYNDFTVQGGYEMAEQILNSGKRVDAIFAGNDTIALGVLDYASSNGYNIPEDLGVIGYDDIFYSELPQIQLTTIYHPKHTLGKYAMDTLFQELCKEKEQVVKTITFVPKLIVRKTTK